ncbi:MAG: phospholipase D-like domain-containing protein [Oligoflexia bacterium]|nr:phospholipase D-like domain-containing protein [Oligoflexia bacterium]
MADLLNQATTSIDMEIYEMDDPTVIAALRGALSRGVTVHIVKEPKPVGAACKVFDSESDDPGSNGDAAACDDQRQLVADVNQAGGKYVPFAKDSLCSSSRCLEHGKVVVVDSSIALVTSGNFNTTNLCDTSYSPKTCNRDYSYLTPDPDIAQSLESVIESDIEGSSYDIGSVIRPGADQKLTIGPNSMDPLVAFIQSAKTSILVENQYLKDPTLNSALIAAANNGVSVQIVLASACSFGRPKASEVKKLTSIFTDFDNAGITTKMFNKNIMIDGLAGYLHAKAIVIDGQRAWMGSVNGSTQALTANREFGVFIEDASDVAALGSVMSDDFSNPREESWQDSLRCAENN